MLGFCFPPVSVTSMSVLFLFLIRKGLRLKRVPRFTKIIVCPQMLLYCFSPPSLPHGSLPPPSPFNFCYLVFPCSCSLDVSAQRGREPLGGGGQLALLLPPLPPPGSHAPPTAADHRCSAPAAASPPLLMLGYARPAFLMQGGMQQGHLQQ